MALSSKPYAERTDLERLRSQWTKLTGLHSREEWSAAIIRAATAAEIAANFAVRREFTARGLDDEELVDALLKLANGLSQKLDRLLLPMYGGKEQRTELRKLKQRNQTSPQQVEKLERFNLLERLSTLAARISLERNAIVHSGQFRDEEDAVEVIKTTKEFVERLVRIYEAEFRLETPSSDLA
jgi:hypothetical protein